MSQTEHKPVFPKGLHKIHLRKKPDAQGGVLVGANTELLIDGQPAKACCFFKLEVKAKGLAKVTMEFYTDDVQIDADILDPKVITGSDKGDGKPEPLIQDGKRIGTATPKHELGHYEPTKIEVKYDRDERDPKKL